MEVKIRIDGVEGDWTTLSEEYLRSFIADPLAEKMNFKDVEGREPHLADALRSAMPNRKLDVKGGTVLRNKATGEICYAVDLGLRDGRIHITGPNGGKGAFYVYGDEWEIVHV